MTMTVQRMWELSRKYNIPIKKSPKSDPQQYVVYRMENEAIGGRKHDIAPRKELKRFAQRMCRMYRIPQVKLRFRDLGIWGAEWTEPNTIDMNPNKPGCMNKLTLIHELAHHLHNAFDPRQTAEPHGPEFMCCYMSMLDTARFVPVVGMRAICNDYGIRFKNPGVGSSLSVLARQCRPR